jgi:hypothetical protein
LCYVHRHFQIQVWRAQFISTPQSYHNFWFFPDQQKSMAFKFWKHHDFFPHRWHIPALTNLFHLDQTAVCLKTRQSPHTSLPQISWDWNQVEIAWILCLKDQSIGPL